MSVLITTDQSKFSHLYLAAEKYLPTFIRGVPMMIRTSIDRRVILQTQDVRSDQYAAAEDLWIDAITESYRGLTPILTEMKTGRAELFERFQRLDQVSQKNIQSMAIRVARAYRDGIERIQVGGEKLAEGSAFIVQTFLTPVGIDKLPLDECKG